MRWRRASRLFDEPAHGDRIDVATSAFLTREWGTARLIVAVDGRGSRRSFMPFTNCHACRRQLQVANSIATSRFSACPYCHQAMELYRCFSCMKVVSISTQPRPQQCPRCFTPLRSQAVLAVVLPPVPLVTARAVRVVASPVATGAAAAPVAAAAAAPVAAAAAAPRVGLAARRGRPAAIATSSVTVRKTVFIPAELSDIVTERIALTILQDNTAREAWLDGGRKGPPPQPTDGLGSSAEMWKIRVAVLHANQTLFMDCSVEKTASGSKTIE
ncbi:hypothetical protein A7982_13490 [Minicystis rosea]|nr:hypothetical protein A7982_13490 [Minicystis rosea]